MKMFTNEAELSETLDRFDELVHACAQGKISFEKFDELYDAFYRRYALHGHESDPEEQELLARYKNRIALHRDVWELILTRVCSDEDADKVAYIAAGRFGSIEAVARLNRILSRYSVSGRIW